jgi:LemA protein
MKKSILTLIIALIIIYAVSGILVMEPMQQDIDGKTGEVWNNVQRAIDLLGRLEQQMTVYLSDRQDLIDKIVTGRNEMLAAKESGDLDAVLVSQTNTQSAIDAVFEAYPDLSLTETQQGLMDETAGSMNRIAYARSELINTQVAYNKGRIIWFWYPKIDILGSSYDAAKPLPTSSFGQ